ncbi:MAG: PD-(D/E)XK nuclease family protein [Candidatus Thermoplasmatota archaeon]|nr:PD-(D/E)XK nuclease family protein [Candidatus Thermoplasmatota archaeon]
MVNKTWSFSKFRLFEECPKAWWLNEHSKGESRNLVPLHSLIGISVHESISYLIDMWINNDPVSEREVMQVGTTLIKQVWRNRNDKIIEYVNRTETDDTIELKIERSFNKLLEKFFLYIWPTFENDRYVTHEKLFELHIEGYKLFIKPDLVTKDPSGNLVITDWKTSSAYDDSIQSFQVLTYALWATRYYETDPQRVVLQVVNLRTGRSIRSKFSQEQEKETLETIKFQCMKLDSIYQEQIPQPKPESKKCKGCLHLNYCEEGKRVAMKTRN